MSNGELFQSVRTGAPDTVHLDENFPFYPLDAPGLPAPGDDFLAAATAMGDPPPVWDSTSKTKRRLVSYGPNLAYIIRRALYDERFVIPITVKGQRRQANLVPGHILGDHTSNFSGGPRRADVMILGKMPGRDEVAACRNMVGASSQVFFEALDDIGVGPERFDWYVDNLVHWPILSDQSDSLPIAHKKECDILLQQTLRLVRPKYLLCLGSDASKWLLGTSFGVKAMTGRCEHLTIPVHLRGQEPAYHTVKVMAATHPAAVFRTPELYPEFRDQLSMFLSLVNGAEIGKRETFVNHVNVYKLRHLREIVDQIRNDPDPSRRIIAIDGEWEGEQPYNPGAYLRTIQFSSAHGEGINVVLRHQGGSQAFMPSIRSAIEELKRLLKYDPANGYFPRIGGHFLRADLPWLLSEGLDLREEYACAQSPQLCMTQGGWDTGLQHHAVAETASFRLTDMTVRLTTAPVYDIVLKQHITDYCKLHDIKKDDLEGYGFLPSWILHPEPRDPEWGNNYAQYDPDVTRRICMKHITPGDGLLYNDRYGNNSWEPFYRSHSASLGVLEMEMNGITLDRDRVDEITSIFVYAHAKLLSHFRRLINWPEFNPASNKQCIAFLFGDTYSGKLDKATGTYLPIRPAGAMTLNLTPIKSTGKRSKLWADIVSRNQQNQYTPSTDKEVLGILGHSHELAMMLRDLKFISQVLKGPLRPPVKNTEGTDWLRDENGNYVYEKGLAAAAQSDGKVHTHISQNKETGRGASARPPLQNISKRREGDYSRILGTVKKDPRTGEESLSGDYIDVFQQALYVAPIRTIFRASPGHVLVEADYTGAELAVIAWLANDPNMIEHVRRNSLPEDDPLHYDIHSNTAVDTFQLSCAPTKKGLKDAGYAPLRVAAKNVNFGIPYGRSAEAIARQCKEEGVEVSIDDCQLMINGYFVRYPGTASFLETCRLRTQDPCWIAGSFGRYRRFIPTRERSVIGEQERQGQNFPIQNTVADAVWTAVNNFHTFKQCNPEYQYRMLLQIHDALLFEVPIPQLRMFLDNVLFQCMVHQVPIWPRYLDNTPMQIESPYYFGIDYDVQLNWGQDITKDQATELGIPLDLI